MTGGFATLALALPSTAFACEFCGGGGDYSSANIIAWMLASAHASILESLVTANDALARGELSAALLVPLLMGLSYGVVHTLGPGHGKIVFGAHSLAQRSRPAEILWRAFASGALHVLSALILIIAASLAFGAGGTPADTQLKPIQFAGYVLVIVIGLTLVLRALFPHLPIIGHRHSHIASSTGVVFSVGLVPCTGSLLVIAFAVANNALPLGLAVITAIGLGMAATLSVIGLLASTAQKAISSDHHETHGRWLSLAGGLLLILTGIFFLHGLTL
jgi:ABC-type nickel/cobalt efflux system permease component RcnA